MRPRYTLRVRFLPLGFALAGCVTTAPTLNGPEHVARAYADALAQGRVDDAWALSAPIDRAQFAVRYADAAARARRAAEVRKAAEGQPDAAVALETRAQGWRVIEADFERTVPLRDDEAARAVVAHFLAAVDAGDFDAVFADLAAPWRARYTPARLKSDFAAEPAVAERLARIRAAIGGAWVSTMAGPQLPLGDGRALKLQREGAALKVAALE